MTVESRESLPIVNVVEFWRERVKEVESASAVAHESGHFIGLGHPDDHGESVVAIMNSHISNVDTLQKDDVDGALAIYGAAAPADTLQPASHPRRSW